MPGHKGVAQQRGEKIFFHHIRNLSIALNLNYHVTGVDSCGGDSGGPLVYRDGNHEGDPWFLIGVISFGTKECAVGKPGVYTKVASYLEWIEKNMEP